MRVNTRYINSTRGTLINSLVCCFWALFCFRLYWQWECVSIVGCELTEHLFIRAWFNSVYRFWSGHCLLGEHLQQWYQWVWPTIVPPTDTLHRTIGENVVQMNWCRAVFWLGIWRVCQLFSDVSSHFTRDQIFKCLLRLNFISLKLFLHVWEK